MTEPVFIKDPGDARIAPYRAIRERDVIRRDGLFIAEGKVVLNVLFSARRFEPVSALVLENRLDGMRATLAVAPPGMPVYVVPRSVMDEVAGFPMHRGVLALGRHRLPDHPASIVPADGRSLVLGLAGIANHDNMGAIFRNAAAFGADAVLLDETCCDPLYRKAIRVSVGAALKVPFARAGTASGMASLLAGAGYSLFALTPSSANELHREPQAHRTALLLGTEGEGLPEDILTRFRTLRITMRSDFDSLNVAAASAVALHHFTAGFTDPT